MGRTLEKVQIKNSGDILRVADGLITEGQIRSVEVDAVVDTGATYLCLPREVIEKLGLKFSHSTVVATANGDAKRRIFTAADITIKERNIQMSVMENDENTPPLIGDLILEALDFVVDPRTRALIPNPSHDGKWTADLY